MDPLCDLEIKVELGDYQCNETNQHTWNSSQDVLELFSTIKTEDGKTKHHIINESTNTEPSFSNNFIDVSKTKNVISMPTEPDATKDLTNISYIRTEENSDPLAIDNIFIKRTTTIGNYIIEETITPKKTAGSWKTYPWLCSICERWPFIGYESLHEHIQTEHKKMSENDLCYRCNDCEKIFPCYSIFLNHMHLNHPNDWKLSCDICDERFKDCKQLSMHRYNHLGKPNIVHPFVYLCFKCGRAYPTKSELNNHYKLSHSSHRPYLHFCEICKESFRFWYQIKSHMRLHKGERGK